MPKPIVFIAALLLALPAFAQTRMPARQVEADTNTVNIAVSLPFTAQVALDWIDANWPAFSSESWSNIDPVEDTVQSVFDWVDDNWQAELDAEGWGYLSPEAPATAQGTFDWIDAYMGIDTNDWGYLAPTASTVQATFTWLDDRFSGFDPEAVVMPGSNIVGGALISNQWTGLMPGTNITGGALISNQWTGLMPGTNITGGALISNQWTGLMPGTNIYGFNYEGGADTWYPFQAYSNYFGYSFSFPDYATNLLLTTNAAYTYVVVTGLASRAFISDPGGWSSNNGVVIPKSGMYYCDFYAGGQKCSPNACAHVVYGVEGQAPDFTIYGGTTNIFQSGNSNHGETVPVRSMNSWSAYHYLPSNTVFYPVIRIDRQLSVSGTNVSSYGMRFYFMNSAPFRYVGADPLPPSED